MLPGTNMAPTPVIISEGQLPLGPVPRHTWIHEDTAPDSLDEACHEIWKRVQLLADRLHAPVLVPPLQHILCSELSATFQKHRIDSLSSNYLPDEPEGLKSIRKAMIGNREREMKLRALCNAQLSAKPMIPSLLRSVNSQKNSKGLEGGSVTGAHSVEGSKLELPFLLKHTDSAKGADNQVTAEETKEAKQLIQNSTSSSANSSTTVSLTTAAQSQAPGQKQQLLPSAEICSKTDSDAVTKNPGSSIQPTARFPATLHSNVELHPPGYPYQQMTLPATSSNIQDLPPMAGNGIQNPFSLSYGFSSVPGGSATTNLNYLPASAM